MMTTPPLKIRLKPVTASSGISWLRCGWLIFAKKPWAFCGLLVFSGVVFMLLSSLPWVGPLAALTLMPSLTWVFLHLTQLIHGTNQASWPQRPRTYALLRLGLLYTAITCLIFVLWQWTDDGKFFALQKTLQTETLSLDQLQARMSDPQLQLGLLLCVVLMVLRSLLFWHTPALVSWCGLGIGKALFFNAVSVWHSKAAWAVYGLAILMTLLALETISSLLVSILGQAAWASMILMPGVFIFTCVFYISGFFSFIESFEWSPASISSQT